MKRRWGEWKVLSCHAKEDDPVMTNDVCWKVKTKELYVKSGGSLSMQRHEERHELWFIAQGVATVYTLDEGRTFKKLLGIYNKFDTLTVPCYSWHQLVNEGEEPLIIIEIQYGTNCIEEDIERFDNYATDDRDYSC